MAGRVLACLGFLVSLALAPPPVAAQEWITQQACQVDEPAIDPAAIDDQMMEEIRAISAGIENGVGRFWRITAPDGAVSHLWGTYHTTEVHVLNLPQAVRDTIARSRVVALEFSLFEPTRADLTAAFEAETDSLDQLPLPTDKLWFEAIDERVAGWIFQRARALGAGSMDIGYLHPALVAEMLLADPCDDFAAGLPFQDNRIAMLGREAGARVVGLEGWDENSRDLRQNRDVTLAMLELYGAALGPDNYNAFRRSAVALYLQGRMADWDAWALLSTRAFFGDEKGTRLVETVDGFLVRDRNFTFRDRAIPMLREGGVFIAVGAAHLPGRTGMVTLLRDAGFAVERIPLPGEIED